jgi:plastocyanin
VKTRFWRAAAFAALLLTAAGGASAEMIQVQVKGLAFVPAQVSAHVGDTVEWTNNDFVVHTATARNRAWDVQLAPHGNGHTELKITGEVEYYCRFHPNMKGTISIAP